MDVDAQEFLRQEQDRLLRAALLLTGTVSAAEDLAQETAVRVLTQWRAVRRADDRRAYTRRMMLNLHLADRRRRWSGEVPHAALPDRPSASPYEAVDVRDQLLRALQALPARQRAAVVLRHYEHLSEAETADVMNCSIGNVKSLTSRGVAALRSALALETVTHDR